MILNTYKTFLEAWIFSGATAEFTDTWQGFQGKADSAVKTCFEHVIFLSPIANATVMWVPSDARQSVLKLCWCNGRAGDQCNDAMVQCMERPAAYLWPMEFSIQIVEQLVVGVVLLQVAATLLIFVCAGASPLLIKCPPWFMEAPNTVATFSVLKLLRFVNPTLLKRFPEDLQNAMTRFLGGGLVRGRTAAVVNAMRRVIMVVMFLSCFILGISGILVYITELFWVATMDTGLWIRQPLHVINILAFINRLSNVVDVDRLEVTRLFLFRYGGSDSTWHGHKYLKVRDYYNLMIMKMSLGKFTGTFGERLECWICLATFRSEDLQRLWLSDNEDEYQDDTNHLLGEVMDMNKRLDPPYWPPHGSDPQWQKWFEGQNLLSTFSEKLSPEDLRLAYFLENMQSYRMWVQEGGADKGQSLVLYDEHGDLAEGGPVEAIQPRLAHIQELMERLLNGRPTLPKLKLAMKLQAEREDLRRFGEESQNLISLGANAPAGRSRAVSRRTTRKDDVPEKCIWQDRASALAPSGPNCLRPARASEVRRRMPKRRACAETCGGLFPQFTNKARLESYLSVIAEQRQERVRVERTTRSWWRARSDDDLVDDDLHILSPRQDVDSMRRRAEILEVFLLLKATDCHSLRHLRVALDVRGLPETLESARLVAEHRQVVLTEIKNLVVKVGKDMDLPFDHGRDTASCFVIAGLLNRVRADASLKGANAAIRALTDLHKRTVTRLKTGQASTQHNRYTARARDQLSLYSDDGDSFTRQTHVKSRESRRDLGVSARTQGTQWGTPRSSVSDDTPPSSSSNLRWSPISPRRPTTAAEEPFRSPSERAAEQEDGTQVEMSVFASPFASPAASPRLGTASEPLPRRDHASHRAEHHAQRRRMQRGNLRG